jgi:hypothetical protein
MTNSVLEKNYEEVTRPYSQKELENTRNHNFHNFRIGKHMIEHKECNHFYFAKANGKKEKEFIECKSVGNCSVCWKINRTPRKLRNKAYELVQAYSETFRTIPSYLTFRDVLVELDFYTWLYNEFNPVK